MLSRAFIGNVFFEYILNGKDALLLLPGLPSIPDDQDFAKYLSEHFQLSVFYLRYPGSWESSGVLNESVVKELKAFIKSLREGIELKSCTGEKEEFKAERVLALGHSFGGLLSLLLISEREVDKGVSMASPLKLDREEMEEHISYIKKCFPNVYRIEPFTLRIDIEKIKKVKENILYFHSKDDPIIPLDSSLPLKNILGDKFTILQGYGHGNKEAIVKRFESRIKKFFTQPLKEKSKN